MANIEYILYIYKTILLIGCVKSESIKCENFNLNLNFNRSIDFLEKEKFFLKLNLKLKM